MTHPQKILIRFVLNNQKTGISKELEEQVAVVNYMSLHIKLVHEVFLHTALPSDGTSAP